MKCRLGWSRAPGSSAAAGLGSEGRRGGGRILSRTFVEKSGAQPNYVRNPLRARRTMRKSIIEITEKGQQDEGSSKSFDHKPHFIHDCFSTLPFS